MKAFTFEELLLNEELARITKLVRADVCYEL